MDEDFVRLVFSRAIKKYGQFPLNDPIKLLQLVEYTFKEGYCLALRDYGKWAGNRKDIDGEDIDTLIETIRNKIII